jgi:hypothetical protein
MVVEDPDKEMSVPVPYEWKLEVMGSVEQGAVKGTSKEGAEVLMVRLVEDEQVQARTEAEKMADWSWDALVQLRVDWAVATAKQSLH